MSYPISLIFDTETTGLPPPSTNPKTKYAPYRDWCNQCRVIQLAWTIIDKNGKNINTYNTFIKPLGYTVSKEAEAIHGFSNPFLLEKGILIEDALKYLFRVIDYYHVECIVAHNLAFDYHVIMQELYKLKWKEEIKKWKKIKGYCTLKQARNYYANKNKKPINYKLATVYKECVGEIDNSITLHHADADIQLCKEIYMKLYNTK